MTFLMKKNTLLVIVATFVLTLCAKTSFSQPWSSDQIDKANTAKSADYLSGEEKDVIKYLNLARMYPQQFLAVELKDYNGPGTYPNAPVNLPSLLHEMASMSPVPPVFPDAGLYNLANCFAKEQGKNGSTGHVRVECPKLTGEWGECCSYGMSTGRDILMQLIIDNGVPDCGHRKICFSSSYNTIGVGTSTHPQYNYCAVLDFGRQYTQSPSANVSFSQNWSPDQIEMANTAKNAGYLTDEEKDVIKYLNLARMFPQQFVTFELKNYDGPGAYPIKPINLASLLKEMTSMTPAPPVFPDAGLDNHAKCLAIEQGKDGTTAQVGAGCPQLNGNWGECSAYGMPTAKDIVMLLIIDNGLRDPGDRRVCFTPSYNIIGIGTSPHPKYTYCAVLDFSHKGAQ